MVEGEAAVEEARAQEPPDRQIEDQGEHRDQGEQQGERDER
jgi:hypothetical protein